MNDFLLEFAGICAEIAAERGSEIDAPEVAAPLADEILELARVAAHAKERRFAPLVSFMAGVAAERAASDPAQRVEFVRALRLRLE